ncbi:MAG: hypothetical protein ACR2Q4_00635, partial [Geminicoccaceae bacterium]
MPKRLFSIARKKEKVGAKIRSLFSPGWPKDQALRLLTCILVLLTYVAATDQANADSTPTIPKACKPEKRDPNHVDKHGNDIAVIIDNREHARQPAAREDVDALEAMLDRHLFADHIIKLERPSYPLICDIFGGCQEKKDDDDPWPPLLAQIVHGKQSRLYVYYLGPARLEGLERQLLFRRLQNPEDSRPGDVLAYPIERLHEQLAATNPRSTLVMMDVSLATRVLPCASEDPVLIDATMDSVRRNYQTLLQRRPPPRGAMELFAASPTEAAHCDRFDQLKEAVDRPLFTKFLLKAVVEGLANQAPFGDGSNRIELGEIEAYTGDKIQRAVQFQWGRRQTVWGRGSSTQPIAMVKPRSLTGDRCIEARRRWEKRLKEASTT